MLPPIISERLIHSFMFWDNGELHQGMRCGRDLYHRVGTFSLSQSQQAYSLGIALCQQQPAILTKAVTGYTVWRSLRSNAVNDNQTISSASLVLQR